MATPSILGLDLPTFSEIRAAKDVPFGETGASSSPLIIYPTLNDMSAAVLRASSPQSQPSDDPHLSSLVAAGYTWLGSTLPEPDLQVKREFQRKRGGKKRDDNVIEKHPLYELFKRPNPYTTDTALWQAFAYSWIIDGNVYWLKRRNASGMVVEIWYEAHFKVKARWVNDRQGDYIPAERSTSVPSVPRSDNPNLLINYYELDRDGQKYRVEPDDIVHFKNGENPWARRYGRSPLITMLREIYGDSAIASYAANLLGGSGQIPYVLGIEDKEGSLSQEDLDNIKVKMEAQTTGQNAGKGLVLSSRVTFDRTGLTPAELDLRVSRYMAEEVFARCTGIPAIVLNFGSGMERSIWNNMKEADRRAVDQYLQPLWWQVAKTITHSLLPDFDQDETHFVEFDLSEVGSLQEDQNELATRIGGMYQNGIIKRSEARIALDYEADPSGLDDVYYIRTGSETVTVEEEQISREASIEATQNPPEPQITQGNQPLALVKGRHSGMLKGAPNTIKQLYSAK